jgi:hypothetical protein
MGGCHIMPETPQPRGAQGTRTQGWQHLMPAGLARRRRFRNESRFGLPELKWTPIVGPLTGSIKSSRLVLAHQDFSPLKRTIGSTGGSGLPEEFSPAARPGPDRAIRHRSTAAPP